MSSKQFLWYRPRINWWMNPSHHAKSGGKHRKWANFVMGNISQKWNLKKHPEWVSKDECPLSQAVFTKVLDTQGMLQAAICREEAGGHIKWVGYRDIAHGNQQYIWEGKQQEKSHLNRQFSSNQDGSNWARHTNNLTKHSIFWLRLANMEKVSQKSCCRIRAAPGNL